MNIVVLVEVWKGTGQNKNPVFYVTLGSGVGGGLTVNGEIYHGSIPGEAEIGHVRLDKSGRILEQSCSGWAVDKKIRCAIEVGQSSLLAQLIGSSQGNEAKHLRTALEKNDPDARRIFDETVEDLAFGLSHVTHLFHPEVIVLGGGLSLMGEILQAAVQRQLGRVVMEAFAPGPEVRIAGLGEDAVPVGALLLARRAVKS